MASYKVPQDVEADDKLIGPFSFRQFIYLIVVVMAGALAWGLAQIFIGLAVIPLPVIILFGALALPLRKDQPMEIYLAAIISFYLKPRSRLWDPEGMESTIEITAPKTIEVKRTKDLSEGEASERLSYLANLLDTQGWAIRGAQSTRMNTDIYLEAQSAEDVLAQNTSVANNFNQLMEDRTRQVREEAQQRMMAAMNAPATASTPVQTPVQPQVAPVQYVAPTPVAIPQPQVQMQPVPASPPVAVALNTPQPAPQETIPVFNPYPNIKQSIIQPLDPDDAALVIQDEPIAAPAPNPRPKPVNTSKIEPSPDIIRLAESADDLSIETIAKQASRLTKKHAEESDGEVVISLR